MESVTLEIQGMHCDGCAERVKRVLERETGVRQAAVSFTTGQAQVTYDEQAINTDRLQRAIERAGYTARVAA